MNKLQDEANEYHHYAEVSVNFWLTKGVHHWIYCMDHYDSSSYYFLGDSYGIKDFATLCGDWIC